MRATAHRDGNTFQHDVEIRAHHVTADEPEDNGGDDTGPSPQELLAASLAACTAITIEMYAERKGWDRGHVKVGCEYEQTERATPTTFVVTLQLPSGLSDEQVDRLESVAATCPVHRTLQGEARL